MSAALTRVVLAGEEVDPARLEALTPDDRATALRLLLADPRGRRWLRGLATLDGDLATQLLAFDADLRATRRDRSLERLTRAAPLPAVLAHARALAGGPAAGALWARLAADPSLLQAVALDVVAHGDARSAEATLFLLALDPLDPYQLGITARGALAAAGLRSTDAAVRGLAAEFLLDHAPAELLPDFDVLAMDTDERMRGVAWAAAFRLARADATTSASALALDEAAPLDARRSALLALATHAPTRDVADVLAIAVAHPDPTLASDAANLLYRLHRDPSVADAARSSPHANVRDIAEQLLDPLRGSPAAGGSRPGDPTQGPDIFEELLRQLEQRE